MAYLLTSATSTNDLLDKLATFAAGRGWTVAWNVTGQLGLSKGNTFLAIGKRQTTPDITRNLLLTGGTALDTPLVATLCSAFSGSTYYAGHSGAPGGASATSGLHSWSNDWYGPFSEVHFFSGPDDNFIHVAARTTWSTPRIDDRWSFMSFGLLDIGGATVPACPYFTGTWFEWWENSATPSSGSYAPNIPDQSATFEGSQSSTSASFASGHQYAFGVRGGTGNYMNNAHVRILSGVLDSAFFTGVPVVTHRQLASRRLYKNNADIRAGDGYNKMGDIANFAVPINSSIGLPMIPSDCVYGETTMSPFCHLGQFPGMRFIRMNNLEAGQEFTANLQTWIAFPFKKKGMESNVGLFAGVNTWDYGYALLKG